MATLKEAVESGRRWKHKLAQRWAGPGHHFSVAPLSDEWITVEAAISSDFEIEEPEPEKPREFYAHECLSPSHVPSNAVITDRHRLVHDADQCDRLKNSRYTRYPDD